MKGDGGPADAVRASRRLMRICLAVAALLLIAAPVRAQGTMPNSRGNSPPAFPPSQSPFGNQGFPPATDGPLRPGFSTICRVGGQACRMDMQGAVGTLCTCRTANGMPLQGVVVGQ